MTSTKDRTWINVHLKTEMHRRLNAWCRRNGLNQQDGLEAMIDICAREVNGLQLVRRPDPPPIVHAPAAETGGGPGPQATAPDNRPHVVWSSAPSTHGEHGGEGPPREE